MRGRPNAMSRTPSRAVRGILIAGTLATLGCATVPPVSPTAAPESSVQLAPAERDSRGQFTRSKAVRAAFMRKNPCPPTGATKGRCEGLQVHHHIPRECGGPDSVENLRWIRNEDHQAGFHAKRTCEPSDPVPTSPARP